ncbi:CcdC family protein [Bacillus horti]|uniref:Membrane protein CcdC involved in cytochrome C biogenesis n=1 Tax=Caldalkalibacillus horti TaxID=77523 RepID=A0ABT9W0Z9_9BACI|nr:cytochrome c biogenesis protein CcdC [Bacillus horti]MDQ0166948.1 membrane protein CcdC involved in cytochrome C biogenesis [Bacillus horti]
METNWMTFVIPSIIAIMMGAIASFIRMKVAKKPVSLKKIVLPPLFMSTGFLMFLYAPTRPSPILILEALSIGTVFAIVLIITTKFEVRDGFIYVQRSKLFMYILVGLLLIRVGLRIFLGQELNPEELSGLFYLMAYAMIIPWRISMLITYLQLQRKIKTSVGEV